MKITAEFCIDTTGNGERRDVRRVRLMREVSEFEARHAMDVPYQVMTKAFHVEIEKAQESGHLSPLARLVTSIEDDDGNEDDTSL